MPKPYPQEFRDDVVKVARSRPEGTTLDQVAADFGIHPMTLSKWLRQAAIDDGDSPGVTTTESAELRQAKKRIRLLEQENEVPGDCVLGRRDDRRERVWGRPGDHE